jgi:hypothetical protein
MPTTSKVTEPTWDRIEAIGDTTRQTADQVVSSALDDYERALFWSAFRATADAERSADPNRCDVELAAQEVTLRA